MDESSAGSPGQHAAYKNHHFTTVSDIWPARSDERVARTSLKIRISPQFWTSHEHETTIGLPDDAGQFVFHLSFGRPMSTKRREGCDDDVQNSHFTTVLDVRRARSDERVARRSQKFAFHHSFGRPTSTKWREGGLPSWSTKPTLRKKKKEILKKSWSTTILSRSSADLLQILSRSSQQIFSADFLSRSSHCLIICCGQGLVVSYCLIILIICCGQGLVVSYCLIICCGQGLVVSYCLIMLVVYTAWVL